MDFQELRTGNLIQGANDLIGMVTNINHASIRYNVDNELENILSYREEIKPIPLTEDWAVKFGYECLIEMAVDFSDLSKYYIEITSENLKKLNVHEAQNLYFALTGEELEIKE